MPPGLTTALHVGRGAGGRRGEHEGGGQRRGGKAGGQPRQGGVLGAAGDGARAAGPGGLARMGRGHQLTSVGAAAGPGGAAAASAGAPWGSKRPVTDRPGSSTACAAATTSSAVTARISAGQLSTSSIVRPVVSAWPKL